MKLLTAAILILGSIRGDPGYAQKSCDCRAEIRGQILCGKKSHRTANPKYRDKVDLSPLARSYEELTTAEKKLPACIPIGESFYVK